jgi:hypothetical protein
MPSLDSSTASSSIASLDSSTASSSIVSVISITTLHQLLLLARQLLLF